MMRAKQNSFIKNIADKITALGLAGPAILLLEANKPLAFIGSQLLLIAQPTVDIFVSHQFTQNAVKLLEEPAQLEQLIVNLECQVGKKSRLKPSIQPDINQLNSEEAK